MRNLFIILMILFCLTFSLKICESGYKLFKANGMFFEKIVTACMVVAWFGMIFILWYVVIKIIRDEQV